MPTVPARRENRCQYQEADEYESCPTLKQRGTRIGKCALDGLGRQPERDQARDRDRSDVSENQYCEPRRYTTCMTTDGLRAPLSKCRAPLQGGMWKYYCLRRP